VLRLIFFYFSLMAGMYEQGMEAKWRMALVDTNG
jgi:hypothetical protein